MPDVWTILGLLLTSGSAACAVYWGVATARIMRTRRTLPTASAGLALAPPPGSVCVVIPAHNESAVLPELIASLRAQDHARVRFVLALDRCTDGSALACRTAIGDDPRFTLVEINACEPGWAGKVHAVYRGVHDGGALNDDYLLFADADTLFHPACVRASLALMHARGLGMLSLLSTMRYQHWFELLVQPACGLELVRQYPLLRANDPERRRAFANGQFMLFTREAYSRFGGHHEVRHELLEDLRLARILEYYAIPQGIFLADDILVCRMYGTAAQFHRGWKRIFTEASNRKPARLLSAALILVFSASALPFLASFSIVFGLLRHSGSPVEGWALAVGVVGLATYAGAMGLIARTARAPMATAAAMPLGSWLAAGLLLRAALDLLLGRQTLWGGMSYDRHVR